MTADTTPDGLPPLGSVVRELGLSARKSLGQHFILDLNLTRRIARAAGPRDRAASRAPCSWKAPSG
jgi:16S rRNA (adenine1518-N6/adenine1519-N6)-dimethyltransferase